MREKILDLPAWQHWLQSQLYIPFDLDLKSKMLYNYQTLLNHWTNHWAHIHFWGMTFVSFHVLHWRWTLHTSITWWHKSFIILLAGKLFTGLLPATAYHKHLVCGSTLAEGDGTNRIWITEFPVKRAQSHFQVWSLLFSSLWLQWAVARKKGW